MEPYTRIMSLDVETMHPIRPDRIILVLQSAWNSICYFLSQKTFQITLKNTYFIYFILNRIRPSGNAPEFNIAYNSLTLIYNQSVLWFGMLFSPLLVVVVAIKFLLLFYVKRACLLHACQPARKVNN